MDNAHNSFDIDDFGPVARIVVIGVGGAGNNAVNRMIDDHIENVEFYVCNTDRQALATSKAPHRIALGTNVTEGLGAGGDPSVGEEAAKQSEEDIRAIIRGGDANKKADMVFIAAGLGKGTGTGASPVIAKIAKEEGALTVAIVTRPFGFEGPQRSANAIEGLTKLKNAVDSIIIVSNDKLLMDSGNAPIDQAFSLSDDILSRSVKTVADLIQIPAIMNLDFADVQTIMNKHGKAVMGTGEASGENRAERAVEEALSNPLLDNTSIKGAKGIILNITASTDIKYFECNKIRKMIIDEIDNDEVFIIPGNVFDKNLEDTIRVSIFATGIGDETDEDYTGGYDTNLKDVEFDIENIEEATISNNNYKKHDNQLSNEQFNIEQQQKQKHNLRKKIGDYQDYDRDFFDMGKTEEYDEYSEKKLSKQNKQNTSKSVDKKQNNQSKKLGFFSSLFNSSENDKSNDIIIEDDDFDIDVDYYNNTPTYLRKNKK